MKIAFVVSGNGYGHLKRVCKVTDELFKLTPDTKVIVAGASAHVRMLNDWGYTPRFKSSDFKFVDTHLQDSLKAILPDDYSFTSYAQSFELTRKLLQAQSPDQIVSDNLVGMLSDFPKTILMGSFLWSDTLMEKFPGNSEIKKICEHEAELLRKYSPPMIGVDDMVMPYVKQTTTFTGLPWFCEKFSDVSQIRNGRNILLTGGGTSIARERLLAIAEVAVAADFRVNLDHALFTQAQGKWKENVALFDFSDQAFSALDWIICRPGIGILTDAVRYDIPVCVVEEADKEMQFNCDRVEQMGIGIRASVLASEVCEQLKSDNVNFRQSLADRKTGGATLAARYILNS